MARGSLQRISSRDGNGICRGLENKLEGFLCDESHVSRSRRPGVGSDGRIQALPLPERLGRREILCLVQLDVGKKASLSKLLLDCLVVS